MAFQLSEERETGHGNGSAPIPSLPTSHRIALIMVAAILTSLIAIGTHYRAHPDEYYHADAFRFFEQHWWPPDLNSSEVIYSPQGWSRVYTSEIVYLAFGKVSRVAQLFWPLENRAFLIYRFSNAWLFLLTLGALFFTRCEWIDVQVLGLVFVCIPQVHYLYAYANSDAFGLSMGVFLFLLTAVMMDQPSRSWTYRHFTLLGALTGLVLVSKKPYLFSLMLPYALIGTRLWREASRCNLNPSRKAIAHLVLVVVIAAVIAGPLRFVYPLTQGDFAETVVQMREERATEEFKPSNPTYETHRLASKGEGYYELLAERAWLQLSLKSFYGLFGYMNVPNPDWMYMVAGLAAILAVCLTTFCAVLQWSDLSDALQGALALSPVIFVLNTGASLARSLHVGFQPQGRYLFPSLIPVALVVTGSGLPESGKVRQVRKVIFGILYVLCLYSLVVTVLLNPELSRL